MSLWLLHSRSEIQFRIHTLIRSMLPDLVLERMHPWLMPVGALLRTHHNVEIDHQSGAKSWGDPVVEKCTGR